MNALANSHRVSHFVIYPNCSLSWRGNQLFFLTIFCVSTTIAMGFTWMGFWMILPFAGLEMLCLGVALYFCRRKLSRHETVTINHDQITVSVGHEQPEASCTLQKAWAEAVVAPSQRHGEAERLWIRSRARRVEIGAFLSSEDKQVLARALNGTIAH